MDAVCSGQNRIVVYGRGDIVFDTKWSNQRTQWMQYAVHSRLVVYGGWDIVFGAKRSNQRMQWTQYTVRSGIVVYGGGNIVFHAKGQTRGCSGCSMQCNSGMWWWGHCSLMQKGQTSGYSVQWTQWNSDICNDVKGILTFVH